MPLISASDLKTHYKTRDGLLRSVDGVDLVVERGETVGLVGESGCGKSTLGKTLLRLVDPTEGRIEFKGEDITRLDQGRLRNVRKSIQMIFQDPFASLNPRHTIGEILEAPLIVHRAGSRAERRDTVAGIISKVGLPADAINRYPHEFSGGQRQRIGIARALLLNPDLIVCDEPVSALDLSIQAQILNLLVEMKKEFGLSYLFISHDLSVVRYFCDRVLVMYLGRIVESADNETLWSDPRHPYTRALMAAVPDPSRPRQAAPLGGDLPSPSDIPSGCRFHTRCPLATDLCRVTEPEFRTIKPGHQVACHVADQIN
ncbi:ABC transporter ATP-binding protein [Ensifer adhaerens]|jgi:peptide/nickel transport system ATP-binding protein|uniref:ABC transporter ATP-binding protein n=1 Tax=Ensifer TaxID=106591 RepID=UPI000712D25A|nr:MULTISPECIES: oligopeptide/dipeptide ABC transporter ATP-binding protein [unclassified Ensifer]KQX45086.1 peptide ABC transporter ATP-binding protein [Ensifer sp. Root1298]KQX76928.1 peptide ABC transporter ATP-binding protein [Ensifer sp. Root1312]KRC26209.1 peptide ABC transporter ATP-binding protein [Ensifer sp. Root74]KRD60218.1 peptide ABC transporter ATP-binding protein [Ensifer sp. Root954]